jgi:hypothetical protein
MIRIKRRRMKFSQNSALHERACNWNVTIAEPSDFLGIAPCCSTLLVELAQSRVVEIDDPNPDGALTPGIYCTVDLQIPRKSPSLLIPANAIIFNRDGLQVAVVEDGVARIRKISVARDLGTQVEVRDGVKAGDQVILNPTVDLMDGSRVRPRAPAP